MKTYVRQQKESHVKHRFHLVLPQDMHDKISDIAVKNRRSVTQQIVCAIQDMINREAADEPTQHVR